MGFRKSSLENMVVNKDFWRNKTVLVTGHTGFKGSWLSLWLQGMGAKVVGYALPPPTQPSFFEGGKIAGNMISLTGDVRDFESLYQAIKTHRPDVVIHMAAQAIVRHSYENPLETYDINVMGTVNLLEAVRRTDGIRVVIIVTSDKCYENREWVWGYREVDTMGGHDPYSNSKGCAELVTAAYRKSFFHASGRSGEDVSIASVRAGNVIGGGDWADFRIVPDIFRSIFSGDPLLVRNPNAVRPWQFVLEPLSGYLRLAEKMWTGDETYTGAWNFGPPDTDCRSVAWIVKAVSRYWGDRFKWHIDQGPHPHEAHFLQLDCSKARRMLGWSSKLDLTTTLQWINEWYAGYHQGMDIRNIAENQVTSYEDLNQ